jgi:hypothetical protein
MISKNLKWMIYILGVSAGEIPAWVENTPLWRSVPMLAAFVGKNTGDRPADVYYVSSRSYYKLCYELFLARNQESLPVRIECQLAEKESFEEW